MTIYQPPSAQENALNTRRNRADLEAEKNSKECNNDHGLNISGDECETNDRWPADNDDEENLHHDTTPMESKAQHAAQVVLHRRNNNRHGKATTSVIGRTITADNQHPASPSSYHSRRGSPQRSFAARRRRTILYTAIGLALLGYFCEMMQLIRRMGSDGGSQKNVIIDLPDSVGLPNKYNSSSKTGNVESQSLPSVASHHVIPPNKEEWDRVRAITNSRAEQRRKRCRPPNLLDAHGAVSVHNVPIANIESETTAPQMTLDLPVHRSLNESIDKTVLSTSNKHIRSNTQQNTAPSICGIHARDASKNDSTNYPSSAYIGPQSRVIVTGALSQLGMEIILQLYKDC